MDCVLRRIRIVLLLILVVPLLSGVSPANPSIVEDPLLGEACRRLMGPDRGTIIVVDMKARRSLAILNPQIAFHTAYPPGSIFKLVTASALLESGRRDPDNSYHCGNHFSLLGREWTCSVPGGHGNVNMTGALAHSCSIYFYRLAPSMMRGEIEAMARRLGLGRSLPLPDGTGTTLAGNVDAPYDPRRFIDYCVGDDPNLTVTPWHVANLVSMLIFDRSISGSFDPPGLPGSVRQIIGNAMETACIEGTCQRIGEMGIRAGGKTGTPGSLLISGKTHGWFAGYYPPEDPRFVVVVFYEDGNGQDAVATGGKVLKLLLDYPPPGL